jgi:hypothetical protein
VSYGKLQADGTCAQFMAAGPKDQTQFAEAFVSAHNEKPTAATNGAIVSQLANACVSGSSKPLGKLAENALNSVGG